MENKKYRILLIEDERLYRMAFKRLVEEEKLPYDCIEAASVAEAQSILDSEKFDIIIADYSLGDGTAFDILGLVKDAPVIFVTGVGDEKVAIKAWKAGAYDYLIKDIQQNYLKAIPITIENAISHKKAREQVQLLSAAVMSTDDSVYITDMDNKIIFVNSAFCRTYGYQQEEVVGKDCDILCKQGRQSADGGEETQHIDTIEVEIHHMRKDSSEFPVFVSRSVIKDENGKEVAFVGVARDISARVFVEDKVRTLNLKLKNGIRVMN
ncbi:MAG: PAS domain-containing protein [Planctomycetota bacterium]|jgi:PAS domain S-box-containing protein